MTTTRRTRTDRVDLALRRAFAAFALVVAVGASTAIGYFGARLNGAMLLRATEFLGADLVLEGSSPAQATQIEAGTQLQLDHAQTVEFSSVIATDTGIHTFRGCSKPGFGPSSPMRVPVP